MPLLSAECPLQPYESCHPEQVRRGGRVEGSWFCFNEKPETRNEKRPHFTVALISPLASRAEISSPAFTCAASFTSLPVGSNTSEYPRSRILAGESSRRRASARCQSA